MSTSTHPPITRFVPGLEPAIAALILPIQREEFGIPITLADQPDLGRIAEWYQRARGDFWVAREGEAVVGTIGLIDFGDGGALRKMFVRADHRGTGLAQALLDTLLAHGEAQSIGRIVLGTTGPMRAAHRFYERNGFRAIAAAELPASFPRMKVDDTFYERRLGLPRA